MNFPLAKKIYKYYKLYILRNQRGYEHAALKGKILTLCIKTTYLGGFDAHDTKNAE